MRKLFFTNKYLIVLFLFASCKKESNIVETATTLNIINAISESSGLIANINGKLPYYLGQPAVSFGASGHYSFAGGNINVSLRDNLDTTANVFVQNISLAANSVHSLFITGTPDHIESILATDTLPYHGPKGHGVADSVVGIRFVNLSVGSTPVSVNIMDNASGSEITSLAYKNLTGFKNYPATAGIESYTFEFRDPTSDSVLASYTLYGVNDGVNGNGSPNNVLLKNITIALIGQPGSQSTMQINNY